MRHGIYYWKCDCPRPVGERAAAFTAGKYHAGGIEQAVQDGCRQALGAEPAAIAPLHVAGDHYAYRVSYPGRELLFRAAADATGDDYMLAEQALVARAAAAGVPVPRILHTCAEAGAPLRWQLMEFIAAPSWRDLLDGPGLGAAEAAALGRALRRLHRVRLDGYGFIDTGRLRAGGDPRGLWPTYRDYVQMRLDAHLAYVADHGLLAPAEAHRAGDLLALLADRCDPGPAVLVHRDPAPWNILGGPGTIAALIDWDDAVAGDGADDLALVRCLLPPEFTAALEAAYWDGDHPPAGHEPRVRLHQLRNLLWKAQIRHQLGYFAAGATHFIARLTPGLTLEQATRAKLAEALRLCEEIA